MQAAATLADMEARCKEYEGKLAEERKKNDDKSELCKAVTEAQVKAALEKSYKTAAEDSLRQEVQTRV